MPRCGGSPRSAYHTLLGSRLYQWQCRRANSRNARTHRRFWEILDSVTESKRDGKHCSNILFHFIKYPSVHSYSCGCSPVCVLDRGYRYVYFTFSGAVILVLTGNHSVIPLAIVGSHRFYDTLTNFLGIIGYWIGTFVAIIILEHFAFRRGSFNQEAYDITEWNQPRSLPWGAAALGAAICSIGLIVPCMNQVHISFMFAVLRLKFPC